MKLHRRVLRLDGHEYTVIGLRPHTAARFATNFFHETWHIVTDTHGSRLLGRLLWGLSYQRRPGTLVLIDRPFLDHTPFEAEPSDPFVLVPHGLTRLSETAARQLRRRLPLSGPPEGTVRWQTPGLDVVRDDDTAFWNEYWRHNHPNWGSHPEGLVTRRGGLIVFSAGPETLRAWALRADALTIGRYESADTDFCWPEGELQIFRDYHRMVTSAGTARREVRERGLVFDDEDALRRELWSRSADIRRRRRPQKV